ncbi:ABC transporter permease [Bradymonadaceae bacterium TMQ3]|uniref:ABC transporter permease n=1 Tax=Lujinxingia sediminis TaxID=2480984 RepID=A0ABY0CRH0_9DELT|nr:ABC transporter permease [Lujinxingia sediminis]RDV38506.1 ABC transporter permease [Bradymonadaceae bacterium TMQ3]RVU42666.1 ABC transporter permease [Lujinxingia sediminis]TXC76726.1 ABC transporter permease [Bradymonadales bacterium TMQ1]
MSYERFIAWRHLRSKRTSFLSTITIIAILGVFLGVTALTSVVAVTGGFEEAFRERVLGVNSHLLVIKYGVDFRDYREIQDDIEAMEGVTATSPFVLHEMIATHGNVSAGILIKGIEPATAESVSDIPKYTLDEGAVADLEFERFPPDGQVKQPKILLGESLAERLGAEKGDLVQVTSPLESLDPGRWSSKGSSPSSRQFEVAGIYRSGFHQYDDRMVMVDYQALQDFFNQGDTVTGVDVRVEDVFAVGALADQLRRDLPEGRFRVMDWRQLNHNLFTSLGLQRLVLAVLFCFIVLVASFNIVCILIMIVLEKNKDIAILKSMGATNWGVMKTFIFQGAVVGFVGTVTGLVGGLAVCLGIKHTSFGLDPSIYMIDHLPVRIVAWEFLAVGLVAMVISLLATIGPSWWASRLNPVDGLRYD